MVTQAAIDGGLWNAGSLVWLIATTLLGVAGGLLTTWLKTDQVVHEKIGVNEYSTSAEHILRFMRQR